MRSNRRVAMNKYKLVPVEPTDEMATAAMNAEIHANCVYGEPAAFSDIWRAMLSAAPAVQGEPIGYIRRSALELMKNDELGVRSNIIKEPRYQDCVALYTAPQPAGAALPPEITREMLGMIIDEVFGGGIEDASVIEDIYRVIARSATPQPAADVTALVDLLRDIGDACRQLEMPSERAIAEWADAIDAAIQEASQ